MAVKQKPDVVTCNACGGTYRTLLADNTLYFHACPPDRVVTPATFAEVTGKPLADEVREPVPNRRDENVHPPDKDGVVAMKSAGLGVTPVVDAAVRASFGL